MSKVYAVWNWYQNDSGNVLCVYRNKKLAELKVKQLEDNKTDGRISYWVEEYEVIELERDKG